MRRRSRRGPNTSESTGKIGQELPSNQPAPLVPLYPDDVPARQTAVPRTHEPRQAQPARPQRAAAPERPPRPHSPAKQESPRKQEWNEPPGSGRLEVETQPEIPAKLALAPGPDERSPQVPKGFV